MNIVDTDEASIEARALAEGWEQEFQEMYYEPLMLAQLVVQFMQLPEEEREELRALDPETYNKVSGYLSKITGGQ